MEEINVESWGEFEEQLKKLQEAHPPIASPLLFRGQSHSAWHLTTTLERSGRQRMPFTDYYRLILLGLRPQIETVTGMNWKVPEYSQIEEKSQTLKGFSQHDFKNLPAANYIVYLRHHGFPSPLLDWTRSSQIAAFFAFRNAIQSDESVSIYVYCESPKGIHWVSSMEAQIVSLDPYIRSHRRHFLQQSEYTIGSEYDQQRKWRFAPHGDVVARNASKQDVLWKFNIPSIERLKVLKLLDNYNLNAYSLFGTEESLMETLALRELDFRDSGSESFDATEP